MPGLAIYLSRDRIDGPCRDSLDRAAQLMRHQPRYTTIPVSENLHWDVRFTGYEQYPRLTLREDSVLVFIEGAIYNKRPEQLRSELVQLGKSLFRPGADGERLTQRWILENDGEYIALFIDEAAGCLALITDALGRLPLFYREHDGGILISRELKYIVAASSVKRMDSIGVAEFLLFGYNMGERTMSEGIKRFAPAVLLRFAPRHHTLQRCYVHDWRLGSGFDLKRSLANTAEAVADRFGKATQDRARFENETAVVLSLSGGLDSRAVAAALHREDIPYSAVTTLNQDRGNLPNAALARRVTEAFGTPHTQYLSPLPTLGGAERLIRCQEGGSMATMTPSQLHLERLESELGLDTVLFTGDGGNNVMYPHLPSSPVKSLDDIIRLAFDTVCYWDIREIEAILKVDCGQVREAYRDVLASYPETEPEWKYGHLHFMGRPYRFVMEGEDRTRFHFWLGAPFWSLPLVRYLLTVPEPQKANYRLYRAVLRRLDPDCLRIPYAATFNLKVPMRFLSVYALMNRTIKSHDGLYRGLRRLLVQQSNPGYRVAEWEDPLRQIVRESAIVAEYFDANRLGAVLEAGLPRMHYDLLATVLFRIDLMERDFAPGQSPTGTVEPLRGAA